TSNKDILDIFKSYKTPTEYNAKDIEDLTKEAYNCLKSLPSQFASGKNPYVLAASVVYSIISKQEKYAKYMGASNAADYARIMHVTEYSLKENAKIIDRHYQSSGTL
ncbi:MAG: hypothetical protein QW429_03110, partial [Thermoprotei archaeon]